MQPIFIINGHDYTEDVAEIKPSYNDLDADGSGRNILNGKMYRKKISTKDKRTVTFMRLGEATMSQLMNDMNSQYVKITMLDPRTNRHIERTYYTSTLNNGIQHYVGGETVYDGVTFDVTER